MAVADQVRRQELEARVDEFVEELVAEVGEPSETEMARANAIARRIQERSKAVRDG